jgi:DNA invertase Pin-like site-specific DNA recombinase
VIVTLFGLFAEIERTLLSLRTKEALAVAKAAGKRLGRPRGILGKSKLDGKKEEIKTLLDQRAHLRRNIRLCVTPCPTISYMATKKGANIVYMI